MLLIAQLTRSIKMFAFQRIRQMLLLNVMSFKVMGIFITFAVAQVFHQIR